MMCARLGGLFLDQLASTCAAAHRSIPQCTFFSVVSVGPYIKEFNGTIFRLGSRKFQ